MGYRCWDIAGSEWIATELWTICLANNALVLSNSVGQSYLYILCFAFDLYNIASRTTLKQCPTVSVSIGPTLLQYSSLLGVCALVSVFTRWAVTSARRSEDKLWNKSNRIADVQSNRMTCLLPLWSRDSVYCRWSLTFCQSISVHVRPFI